MDSAGIVVAEFPTLFGCSKKPDFGAEGTAGLTADSPERGGGGGGGCDDAMDTELQQSTGATSVVSILGYGA